MIQRDILRMRAEHLPSAGVPAQGKKLREITPVKNDRVARNASGLAPENAVTARLPGAQETADCFLFQIRLIRREERRGRAVIRKGQDTGTDG